MNVLVVNAGSSSLKYQLWIPIPARFSPRATANVSVRTWASLATENGGTKQTEEVPFPITVRLSHVCSEELEKTNFTIDGIGHRIVQGGWYF